MSATFSDHSIKALLQIAEKPCPPPVSTRKPERHRKRTLYSSRALEKMEAMFEDNSYPDMETREQLSTEIGVSESKIQIWFQNRRTRSGRTKPRRGPRPHSDVKSAKMVTSFNPTMTPPMPVFFPFAPLGPPPVLPALMPVPLKLDVSPLSWVQSAHLPVQHNRLRDLLIGELRSYEINSSGSNSEDSTTE